MKRPKMTPSSALVISIALAATSGFYLVEAASLPRQKPTERKITAFPSALPPTSVRIGGPGYVCIDALSDSSHLLGGWRLRDGGDILRIRGGGRGGGEWGGTVNGKIAGSPQNPAVVSSGGRFGRYLNRLFDEADASGDGYVSFSEAYELVLRMYVQINQKAPIDPPPRNVMMRLFESADLDRNGKLSREEFRRLAMVLASRATVRVVANRVVTIVGAPMLAMMVVRKLSGLDWMRDLLMSALSAVGLNKTGIIATMLTKPEFWRTGLTVVFMMSLGNTVISLVNAALDRNLPDLEDASTSRKQGGKR